ncbi:MAG: transglutaminase domain-containing protein [Saprospiraceae bacterium]|nr:hypothetical protein [Lewinella sp.]
MWLRLLSCLLFIMIGHNLRVVGQIGKTDFSAIDQKARQAPAHLDKDLSSLTAYLTEDAAGELGKVRAVYVWIITHIAYDYPAAKRNKRSNHSIQDILDRRKALCFGYAQLFQEMCRLSNIPAYVVNGYAREVEEPAPSLDVPNHSWNAALVDGKWLLFDPTWGQGTTSGANPRYTLENDPFFVARPDKLILSHLPGNPMWQMLPNPLSADAFMSPASTLEHHLSRIDSTYSYADSLQFFQQLSTDRQRLHEAEQTFRSFPSESNRVQFGHALFDYAGILADTAELLQNNAPPQKLRQLNAGVISLCRKAQQHLTNLYPWQQELFINALINQAVLLYNQQDELEIEAQTAGKEALSLLHEALATAETGEPSFFKQMARQRCMQYIQVIE